MLGVPEGTIAQNLTGHLLLQIKSDGVRGGPLGPLAAQLNHDETYLQGQSIEAMLARLDDGRSVVAKWRVGAAGLSVVAAAAIGLVTALVTAHSSWGLWVALAALVIVGAFLQVAVIFGDRLRKDRALETLKSARDGQ